MKLWTNHGTKVLGSLTSIIAGFIAIPDFIPQNHVKYWAAANVVLSVMTVKRGYTNSRQ